MTIPVPLVWNVDDLAEHVVNRCAHCHQTPCHLCDWYYAWLAA